MTNKRPGRSLGFASTCYRTLENVIDGVVITFIDITEVKRLEAELRGEHR